MRGGMASRIVQLSSFPSFTFWGKPAANLWIGFWVGGLGAAVV